MADAHLEALLDTPTLDSHQLARLRRDSPEAVQAWVDDNAGRLLVVTHEARTILPAFQFDDAGQLHEHIGQINALLNADSAMSAWSRWAWWHSRTSYLSGQSPLDLVHSNHKRVLSAASRMARSNTAARDAQTLREQQQPADDLDGLVEWTATQPEVLSQEERRARVNEAADEIDTRWRDVMRRLGES